MMGGDLVVPEPMVQFDRSWTVPLVFAIRERLLSHGWQKESYGLPDSGPNCPMGAAFVCLGRNLNTMSLADYRAVKDLLTEVYGTAAFYAFNDSPEVQLCDIIGLLDQYLCEESP